MTGAGRNRYEVERMRERRLTKSNVHGVDSRDKAKRIERRHRSLVMSIMLVNVSKSDKRRRVVLPWG